MDLKKQKEFNERMGKRQKFSKGGLIKRLGNRAYFDDGGTVLSGPSGTGGSAATVNNNGLVGTIGDELGLNNEFQGQSANIQAGTNTAQLNNAYTGAQNGLAQQEGLASEVQPGTQQGLGTQAALTGQLEGVINGTGPNAAQAALNQNTATNVANQASLAAGQRGASSNVGLLARQAAQTGAAAQQTAVGQAATTQAQQQIAAQQQLAGLAQTQVGQGASAIQGVNNAQQNEQNILQGANTSANNANVAMQSNINNVNAQIATANQNQSSNIAGGIINGAASLVSGIPGLAKGGEVGHQCAGPHCTDRQHYAHLAEGGALSVSSTPQAQGVGPWLNSQTNTSSAQAAQSGSLPQGSNQPLYTAKPSSPAKPAATPAPVAGNSAAEMNALPDQAVAGNSAESMAALPDVIPAAGVTPAIGAAALSRGGSVCDGPHKSHVGNFLAQGGATNKVPAMVSPGERYLNPKEVKSVIEDGKNPLKAGVKIPGKPKVKGDSLKNDVVPMTLEDGGVVLPRHITNKKNRDHAELFVRRAVHMKAPKGGR